MFTLALPGGYIANCDVGVFTLALPGGWGISRTVLLVCSLLHYRGGGGVYRELCWCVHTCTTGGGGYIANCVGVFTLALPGGGGYIANCVVGVFTLALPGGGISRTVLVCSHLHYRGVVYRELCWCVHTCTTGGGGVYRELCWCVHTCTTPFMPAHQTCQGELREIVINPYPHSRLRRIWDVIFKSSQFRSC